MSPTLCIVGQFIVLRSEIPVCETSQPVGEDVALPLPVVGPVVELVGRAAAVALGHAVRQQAV